MWQACAPPSCSSATWVLRFSVVSGEPPWVTLGVRVGWGRDRVLSAALGLRPGLLEAASHTADITHNVVPFTKRAVRE